jgi:hypothetical protein
VKEEDGYTNCGIREEPKERSTRPNLRFLKRMLTNTVNTNEAIKREAERGERDKERDKERERDGRDDRRRRGEEYRYGAGPVKRGRGSSFTGCRIFLYSFIPLFLYSFIPLFLYSFISLFFYDLH